MKPACELRRSAEQTSVHCVEDVSKVANEPRGEKMEKTAKENGSTSKKECIEESEGEKVRVKAETS